ncbi:MAG: hypothetical protein IT374_04165 [Polyangiaceae bacterium]|nr:hypothetical protein [Polyangiaceae bacterium]
MPLTFRETMAGAWSPVGAPTDQRRLSFTVRALSRSLPRFAARRVVDLDGTIDAEGLASGSRLYGTLGLDVARTGTLPYDFRFRGDDGRRYRFVGQKDVSLARLHESMTVLPAEVRDDADGKIGDATVRFDVARDLVAFLRSWKIV